MLVEKFSEFMVKFFGASWKTSVGGLVGSVATCLIPYLQDGKVDTKTIGIAIAIGLLGFLAKDSNVSGKV